MRSPRAGERGGLLGRFGAVRETLSLFEWRVWCVVGSLYFDFPELGGGGGEDES
jgi:hypothetical protein